MYTSLLPIAANSNPKKILYTQNKPDMRTVGRSWLVDCWDLKICINIGVVAAKDELYIFRHIFLCIYKYTYKYTSYIQINMYIQRYIQWFIYEYLYTYLYTCIHAYIFKNVFVIYDFKMTAQNQKHIFIDKYLYTYIVVSILK